MMKKYKTPLILSSLVTLLPMVAGFLLWDRLPEVIPVHWGINGTSDAVAGPWFVVFLLPLVLVALQWLCVWVTFRDPRAEHQNPKALQMIFWIMPVISIFCCGTIYVSALGNGLFLFRLVPILLGVLFIVIGNYMPKITPNSYLGIKCRWTFHSEENWHASHRFCGKVSVVCGFITLLGVFLPEKCLVAVMCVPLLPLVLSAFLYPYLYYRKQVQEGLPPVTKKPMTKGRVIGSIGSVIACILLAVILVYIMFTGDIRYEFGKTAFTIEADFWTDLTVDYEGIDSIEYLEDMSYRARTSGFNSPRLSMGAYRNETYGKFTLYAYTKCDSAVMIRFGDQLLMINGETPEATAQLYQRLKEIVK